MDIPTDSDRSMDIMEVRFFDEDILEEFTDLLYGSLFDDLELLQILYERVDIHLVNY